MLCRGGSREGFWKQQTTSVHCQKKNKILIMKRFLIALWSVLVAFLESAVVTPTVKGNAPQMQMAKVKFSALISDMRNKLNGSVFSKNRAGSYLRNKVTPTNPSTPSQAGVRSILGTLASGWRTLTDEERTEWNSVVESWLTTDIFGDSVTPSGFQLYVRLNGNIVNAGGVALVNPPAPMGISGAIGLTAVPDVGLTTLTCTTDPDPVPADQVLIVESTAPLSAGISNFSGKYRKIGSVAAAGSIGDQWANYIAKFGVPTVGLKSSMRVKFVNIVTGESSPYLSTNFVWI